MLDAGQAVPKGKRNMGQLSASAGESSMKTKSVVLASVQEKRRSCTIKEKFGTLL